MYNTVFAETGPQVLSIPWYELSSKAIIIWYTYHARKKFVGSYDVHRMVRNKSAKLIPCQHRCDLHLAGLKAIYFFTITAKAVKVSDIQIVLVSMQS